MSERFRNYWRVWRGRGAATMDHGLWAYWALFGKYPPLAVTEARQGGDGETRLRAKHESAIKLQKVKHD